MPDLIAENIEKQSGHGASFVRRVLRAKTGRSPRSPWRLRQWQDDVAALGRRP